MQLVSDTVELSGRKADMVAQWMKDLGSQGRYAIHPGGLEELQKLFYGGFADQKETLAAIRRGTRLWSAAQPAASSSAVVRLTVVVVPS